MSEHSQHMEHDRGSWGSNFGFLMAAVGSAVGLGNIWGFPYKMGSNGGFAFLVIYLLLVIFVGVVVMLGELSIGRKTGLGAVGAYTQLGKKYKWIGLLGILAAFCLLAFYNVLGGLVMRYMFGFFLEILGVDGFSGQSGNFFSHILYDYSGMIFFHVLFIVLNIVIVMGGIQGGIEKFCTVAMPALFFMLLFVIIYVAFQPGAGAGYAFMLTPNFEPISTFSGFLNVLKTAAGQMFFSLSLGMGAIISYGSYLDKKENLQKNALIIPACDTLIAVMAACAILPACAAFGMEYSQGPGLLFNTMQNVFLSMGLRKLRRFYLLLPRVHRGDHLVHLPVRGHRHLAHRRQPREGQEVQPHHDHVRCSRAVPRRRPARRARRSGRRQLRAIAPRMSSSAIRLPRATRSRCSSTAGSTSSTSSPRAY